MSRRQGWINIEGLVPVKDAFYRYQMPPLRGHTEKTWTVLASFVKTSNALHRQDQEVLKYLGLALHTQTKFDEQGRACIKGHFSDRDMQKALRHYIEGFVLCGGCKKPETAYRIRGSGKIVQKCFGCGQKTPLDMGHKLCAFIKTQYRAAKAARNAKPEPDMVHALSVRVPSTVASGAGKSRKKPKKKDSNERSHKKN